MYNLNFKNLTDRAKNVVTDNVNRILNLGMVEYQDDYVAVLDIEKSIVYQKINRYRKVIELLLQQVEKLKDNVRREQTLVESIKKSIKKKRELLDKEGDESEKNIV